VDTLILENGTGGVCPQDSPWLFRFAPMGG